MSRPARHGADHLLRLPVAGTAVARLALGRRSGQWTVPIGAQAGRVIKIGKLPVNLLLGAYYNIVKLQYGADWQLRSQVVLIF